MRVIIAGSRSVTSQQFVDLAMGLSGFKVTEVVSGGALGVDTLGKTWANKRGIPVKLFPANWKAYGKGAGFIRNQQMAEYAEALVAVWDGASKGTKSMITLAKQQGLKVFCYTVMP